MTASGRRVLLVLNSAQRSHRESAVRAAEMLYAAGIEVLIRPTFDDAAFPDAPELDTLQRLEDELSPEDNVELVLVLGGDGTFLRAAYLAHRADVPVLGINLGHVGFLAQSEAESLEDAIHRVIQHSYSVDERMTIDVTVFDGQRAVIGRGFALNEVSVENLQRSGVLDATLEVDGRPVSSFGCDGVLVSTPTGSTAYAFSAGGPVLWPSLDAILVVPNNAHALFTKPLVVSPQSVVAVESDFASTQAEAVLDGFRKIPMPPGSRVEVQRGRRSVKWVRLDDFNFTDRLVSKLQLPTKGWRGPGGHGDTQGGSAPTGEGLDGHTADERQ